LKYRKLSPSGDYSFGNGAGDFYVDSPDAVAQAVKTRLGLIQGEWFLDINVGTPYNSQVLGAGKIAYFDYAIQDVIVNTQGVRKLVAYSSNVSPTTRKASISCTIDTVYGATTINQTL